MKSFSQKFRILTALFLSLMILMGTFQPLQLSAETVSENPEQNLSLASSIDSVSGTADFSAENETDSVIPILTPSFSERLDTFPYSEYTADEAKPSTSHEIQHQLAYNKICYSQDELALEIRPHLLNGETSFQVALTSSMINWYNDDLLNQSFKNTVVMGPFWCKVFAHTGVPNEGDYLFNNIGRMGWTAEYNSAKTAIVMTMNIEYRHSASQEKMVTQEVKDLIASLDLTDKTDYEKVEAVYTYMVKNIKYDHSYERHSAYNALIEHYVVCQGYASAFYRLMLTLGLDCRMLSSRELNHAWNIVKLDGQYYLVDSTWDSNWYEAYPDYRDDISDTFRYFLKSKANFVNHDVSDDQFSLSSFSSKYPISYYDYNPSNLGIVKQPVDVTTDPDQTVKFSVKATGKGVSYQWYFKLPGQDSFQIWDGKTRPTVSVTATQSKHGMQVYCYVYNTAGYSRVSDTATLKVTQPDLAITSQPQNITVDDGDTATFKIEAVGDNVKYQWYFKNPDDASYTLWNGKVTPSITFTATAAKNNMKFYCIVTDDTGKKLQSQTVMLTVRSNLTIITQPANKTASPGTDVTFSVKAQGDGLTYQWYFKNPGDETYTLWSGKTTASVTLSASSGKDGMKLYCKVKDKYGRTVSSNVAVLTVQTPLQIIQQPASVEVLPGSTATFTVKAIGDKLTYQWYFKNPGDDTYTLWSGKTSASVSLSASLSKDGMRLFCKVYDNHGGSKSTEVAKLTVRSPLQITKQPVSTTVDAGSQASFSVGASGDKLTYQWYFKNPGDAGFTLWSGKTASTASFDASTSKNGMQLRCVITDCHGVSVTSNTVTLTVRTPLTITTQPSNKTASPGTDVSFSVKAAGDGLTYQWYYKNTGDDSYTLWSGKTTSSVTLSASLSKDGMKLYCKIKDKYGRSVSSDVAVLSVQTPLQITQQPVSVEVAPGSTATFTVKATGDKLTYQWYYKNPGDDTYTLWSGKTSASVSLSASLSKDGMRVFCKVYDSHGGSKSTEVAKLTVRTPLQITKQPVGTTVDAGTRVSFAVTAAGDQLTYQWYYKNAGDEAFKLWSGKTAASASMDTSTSKNGMQFRCVIKDCHGASVTSNTVTLTVRTPLAITQQPLNVTTAAGTSATFKVKATGDGLTYQWYYKNADDAGYTLWSGKTSASATLTVSQSKNGMKFYCKIKDQYGRTVSSNVVTLSVQTPLIITQQPLNLTAYSGDTVTFKIVATGYGLTYQWYYKNPGDASSSLWTGRNVPSFNFTANDSKNGMQVYCVVSDAYGNQVTSQTITLTVTPKVAVITQQPTSLIADPGTTATFTVKASGSGLKYQWYYKMDGDSTYTLWSGKTSASVSTSVSASKNMMKVYCLVTDSFGNKVKSNAATLFVN